jgi:hypothetical protein
MRPVRRYGLVFKRRRQWVAPVRHSDTVVPVTSFFAMPEETEAWVAAEGNRLGLVMYDEVLAGGSRRCFLWPQEAQPLPPPARGVMVLFPAIEEAALTMGGTGSKASAFDDRSHPWGDD